MFGPPFTQWVHLLRDSEKVARGPHRYRYLSEPLASAWEALNVPVVKTTWRVTVPLRMVDEPARLKEGVLALMIENAGEKVDLELTINGKPIPKVEAGGSAEYPRYPTALAKMSRIELSVSTMPLIKGENHLGFRLLAGGPEKLEVEPGRVAVTEVELFVPSSAER
jgi:hypothetical protein